ncbi:ROK family transcriptional regulator [Thermatribacter velox]|uniref:ROK family transcriptional regulator n=1 Tax=Thermatribacter velox TaxID=3039681 RepID=A0ABZ2YCD8_9BACT
MYTFTASRINEVHKKLVFRLVWKNKSLSRTQIGSFFGFSKSTVSQIVKELIAENLLIESGRAKSSVGKKPVLLSINPDGPRLIGSLVKDSGEIAAALISLNGSILHKESCTARDASPNQVAREVVHLIQKVLQNFPQENILGIGIGVPGIVHHKQGTIEYSAHFSWKNLPFLEMVKEYLLKNVPVVIDNRTIAATLGEMWFGLAQENKNFVCINCGEALGMGIVIEERVYRGAEDGAGEVGHIVLDNSQESCFCGKKGCLETSIALPKIMEKLNGKNYYDTETAVQILTEKRKESKVKKSLEDAFLRLGDLAAVVVNILAPEKVVFTGALTQVDPLLLLEKVKERLNERALEPLAKKVKLTISPLQRDKEVLWGAALVMEHLFNLYEFTKEDTK